MYEKNQGRGHSLRLSRATPHEKKLPIILLYGGIKKKKKWSHFFVWGKRKQFVNQNSELQLSNSFFKKTCVGQLVCCVLWLCSFFQWLVGCQQVVGRLPEGCVNFFSWSRVGAKRLRVARGALVVSFLFFLSVCKFKFQNNNSKFLLF